MVTQITARNIAITELVGIMGDAFSPSAYCQARATAAGGAHAGELRHAPELHPKLRSGDVLVGERGLCSYKHVFELVTVGFHAVLRMGFVRKIGFPAEPGPLEKNAYNRHRAERATLVQRYSDDDQVVEIVKPHNRPKHVTAEEIAKIPAKQTVWVLRFRIQERGVRSSEITLMTTLLDAKDCPAAEIAELYRARWRIEQNMRHLKRTLNMERLKCETVEGVQRELTVFAMVYNAMCACRAVAAEVQGVAPLKISFVDTLRRLRCKSGNVPRQVELLGPLLVLPERKPRTHPRALKRSDSPYPVMNMPRKELIKIAMGGGVVA